MNPNKDEHLLKLTIEMNILLFKSHILNKNTGEGSGPYKEPSETLYKISESLIDNPNSKTKSDSFSNQLEAINNTKVYIFDLINVPKNLETSFNNFKNSSLFKNNPFNKEFRWFLYTGPMGSSETFNEKLIKEIAPYMAVSFFDETLCLSIIAFVNLRDMVKFSIECPLVEIEQ